MKNNKFYDMYSLEVDEVLDTHLSLNDEPTVEELRAIEMSGEDKPQNIFDIYSEYKGEKKNFQNTVLEERVQDDGTIRRIKFYGEEILDTIKKPNRYQSIIKIKMRIKELNQDIKRMVDKGIHKPEVFRNLKLEMIDYQKKLNLIKY